MRPLQTEFKSLLNLSKLGVAQSGNLRPLKMRGEGETDPTHSHPKTLSN